MSVLTETGADPQIAAASPTQLAASTMCRRVVVSRHGGPDVLQVVEDDLPEPRAGEVRVRTLAAGVSAYDMMFRRSGLLPGSPHTPFTPGEDVVGVVDKVAAGVTAPAVGQRVAGTTISLGVGGGYAEYVCLPAADLVAVPADADAAHAVCVVINYLTAYSALHQTARVRRGERILVHGAAGGVGSALLDLGRLAGLELFGTASPHNHQIVRAFGATPIDYHTEDFVKRVRELTGDGVDVVFDPIGGARQIWRSYRALRAHGRLLWFGVAAHKQVGSRVIPLSLGMLALLKLLPDGKRALTSTDFSKDNQWYRETLGKLLDWLVAGKITPLVAQSFPLTEARRAHQLMEAGHYAGKLVLVA